MSRPAVFAHRGASGSCFENTMTAFQKAADQGADGIELDVQISEDGVPFVIHDSDLIRLAGIRRTIATMTSTELKKAKVGRKYPVYSEGILFLLLSRQLHSANSMDWR